MKRGGKEEATRKDPRNNAEINAWLAICQPLFDCRRAGYEIIKNPDGEFTNIVRKTPRFLDNSGKYRHAEMRILEELHKPPTTTLKPKDLVPVGVSKLACAPCYATIEILKKRN